MSPRDPHQDADLGAAERPVHNYPDNASAEPSGASRFGVLDWLRDHSSLPRQRTCMTGARAGDAVLGRRDERAVFTNTGPCGLRSCPNCGPRIQADRRDQVHDLVDRARCAGYSIRFLTLTLRHSRRDRLADTLDALLACWKGVTSGRWWMNLRKRHGVRGFLRVLECKWGCAHGWHPHLHVLLFVDGALASDDSMGEMYVSLLQKWGAVTAAAGYAAQTIAQDMREVRDDSLDALSGYLSKDFTRDIAWEVTGGDLKTRGESHTPAQLLARAAAGDRQAARLWREFEQATHNRQTWAAPPRAFRDEIGDVTPERPSFEVAADRPATERLVSVPRGEYAALARVRGLRGETAQVIETGADAGLLAHWLQDRGISSRPIDPEPTTRVVLVPVPAPEGAPEWLALA